MADCPVIFAITDITVVLGDTSPSSNSPTYAPSSGSNVSDRAAGVSPLVMESLSLQWLTGTIGIIDEVQIRTHIHSLVAEFNGRLRLVVLNDARLIQFREVVVDEAD